jgi:hypothetical protein
MRRPFLVLEFTVAFAVAFRLLGEPEQATEQFDLAQRVAEAVA